MHSVSLSVSRRSRPLEYLSENLVCCALAHYFFLRRLAGTIGFTPCGVTWRLQSSVFWKPGTSPICAAALRHRRAQPGPNTKGGALHHPSDRDAARRRRGGKEPSGIARSHVHRKNKAARLAQPARAAAAAERHREDPVRAGQRPVCGLSRRRAGLGRRPARKLALHPVRGPPSRFRC